MPEDIKPDVVGTDNGDGQKQEPTPVPAAKKKFEFEPEAQTFIQTKIDEAYTRAFNKAKTELGGQLADAQIKLEAALEKLKGAPAPESGKKDEPKADPAGTKAEVVEDVKKLRAQLDELQSGLATVKGERDTARTSLEKVDGERKEATKRDQFLAAIPASVPFFNPNDAYRLALEEGQLQLDASGKLVVINPATGLSRLGRDMEPMSPSEYIALFAADRAWMVKSDVEGGTGAGEARQVGGQKAAKKSFADMSSTELEAEIQRVKNTAR